MSIEVKRNHGKPTAAERARAKLEAQKAAEKAAKTGVAVPTKAKPAKAAPAAKATTPAPAQPQMPQMSQMSVSGASGTSGAGPAAKPAKPAKVKPTKVESTPKQSAVPEAEAPKIIAAKAVPDKPRNYQIRFTGMKPNHVVEAALFAAGKPILVEEIAEASGLRPEVIKDALKEIQKDYENRDTVLEVSKAGTKWAMQVRSKASEPAAKFAPMEIPLKTLKTLALIAYHQPMKQSELVDMLGTKVYDHVPELIERGLLRAREEGVTKILTTTALFPEYFGIDGSSAEEIRMALAKLVGMDPEKARLQVKRDAAPAQTADSPAEAAPEPQAEGSGENAAEPGHEAHLQH